MGARFVPPWGVGDMMAAMSAARLSTVITLAVVLTMAGLVACGGDGGGAVTGDSGISGQVLAGPQCPVVMEGSPCPDKPLQATLRIERADGGDGQTVETNQEGRFRVALAPGDYVVRPQPVGDTGFPVPAGDQAVSVTEGRFTEIAISYDTGIR